MQQKDNLLLFIIKFFRSILNKLVLRTSNYFSIQQRDSILYAYMENG